MKRTIESRDELLKSLAHGGDSHAFFSIATPYLKARYLRERSTGASHQDAQNRVLAEATELLEKMQNISTGKIDSWFEEHCMMLKADHDDEFLKTDDDKNLNVETAAFLGACSREILRIGSNMKRSQRERERRFPYRLLRHRIVRIPLLIVAAGLILTGTGTLMLWQQTSLTISIDSPHRHVSFRIPSVDFSDTVDKDADLSGSLAPAKIASKNDSSHALSSRPDSSRPKNIEQPASPAVPPAASVNNPAPVARRPLPPVIPKARMILPPMPAQPLDATAQPATGTTVDPTIGTPPTPPPAQPAEPGSTY
jgi:hypothetical protein